MDQIGAFRDTVDLAKGHRMPEMPGTELGLSHLRVMLAAVESGVNPQDTKKGFSEGKLGRWLGWAQCAVVSAGIGVTLEDMKEINKRHASGLTLTVTINFPDGREIHDINAECDGPAGIPRAIERIVVENRAGGLSSLVIVAVPKTGAQ